VIVQISERWRIISDDHSWTIQQRSAGLVKVKKAGRPPEVRWNSLTYHATFSAAAKHLAEQFARADKTTTDDLGVALEKVADWHKRVAEAVEGKTHESH